jgi:hypothetical protein
MEKLKEPILEDDYPVYAGYLYVCDGALYESELEGTVKTLKARKGFAEVRRCDIVGRRRALKDV